MSTVNTGKKNQAGKRIKREEVVKMSVTALARQLGPLAKLPTITELSRMFNVSRSTLDRVFRQLESDHILECRHGSGVYVSPYSSQFTLGLVFGATAFSESHSEFWSMLHREAIRSAEDSGEVIRSYFRCPSLGEAVPPTHVLRDDLQKGILDGIVAIVANQAEVDWLKQWDKPVVTLGKRDASGWVQVDERESLRLHVSAVRGRSPRRVALVGTYAYPAEYSSETDAPTRHFREAMQAANLPYDPSLRWFRNLIDSTDLSDPHDGFGMQLAWEKFGPREQARALPPDQAPPDAVVCLDDTIAHGLLIGLVRLGWNVGTDLTISTGTNKGSARLHLFESEIFRVQVDPKQLADHLLDLLMRRIQRRPGGSDFYDVKPELIRATADAYPKFSAIGRAPSHAVP